MERMVQKAASAALVAALSLVSSPVRGQESFASQFFIAHTLGNLPSVDPLVDPNTFFVVGKGQTKDLPLAVRAVNFAGEVRLSAYCCLFGSAITSRGLTLEVLPKQVRVASGEGRFDIARLPFREFALAKEVWEGGYYASPVLRVTTPAAMSSSDRGNFLAVVEGSEAGVPNGLTDKTYVVLSVLDIVADNTQAFCGTQLPFDPQVPDVLPLEAVTRRMFDLKAANPAKTKFSIAIGGPSSFPNVGWQVDIEKSETPLHPDEARIIMNNTTTRDQSLWTYNSDDCARAHATHNLVLSAGDTGEIRIFRGDTTTIVLSQPYQDMAVFAEPNFWTLFGGRKVTITPVE